MLRLTYLAFTLGYGRDSNDAARRIGSFELICNFVEPGLNTGLVNPGEPDTPAPPITSSPTLIGSPPGIAITFGRVTCWRTTRVIIGKPLSVGSSRSAKASCGVGLAARVFHRVRAGVVAAQRDNDLAGAIDDDRGDGIATGLERAGLAFISSTTPILASGSTARRLLLSGASDRCSPRSAHRPAVTGSRRGPSGSARAIALVRSAAEQVTEREPDHTGDQHRDDGFLRGIFADVRS